MKELPSDDQIAERVKTLVGGSQVRSVDIGDVLDALASDALLRETFLRRLGQTQRQLATNA
jgi:predicted secreted protein